SFGDPLGQLDPPTNCTGTLGVAGYFRDDTQTRVVNGQTFSRILEGDVVFNDGWAGCGFYETYTNLAGVAAHELGHVLGLGHSQDPDATMYAFAHFDGRGAALRDDDRAGVRFAYPSPTATLTVVRNGSGNGTIASSPAGIACGTDCREGYASGTVVTLTAATAAGSSFGGWAGPCTGTGAGTFTLTADTTVTASLVASLSGAITSPAAGSTVAGTVTVSMATTGGSGGNTYKVAVDGATVYTGTTPSFAWNTSGLTSGSHTLTATVTDSGGRGATSTLSVTVSAPAGLRIATTAPNPDSTVRGVVWGVAWVDGAIAPSTGTLTTAGAVVKSVTASSMPVSLDWDSRLTPNGVQTLTVAARDAAGKTGSAALSVTVANAGAPPPPLTASFTSPASGATVSGNVTVGMAGGGAAGAAHTVPLADGRPPGPAQPRAPAR